MGKTSLLASMGIAARTRDRHRRAGGAGVARLVTYAERLRVTEVGLLDADGVAEALQGPFARQQDYVVALSRRGGSARTAQIADDLGGAPQDLGYLRDGLLRSGVVYAPTRGTISLTVPPMAHWVVAENDGRHAPAPQRRPEGR